MASSPLPVINSYTKKTWSWLRSLRPEESITVVKTLEAVDQDKQGIRGIGFGQLVTARDAIWTQKQTDFIKRWLQVGLCTTLDPGLNTCKIFTFRFYTRCWWLRVRMNNILNSWFVDIVDKILQNWGFGDSHILPWRCQSFPAASNLLFLTNLEALLTPGSTPLPSQTGLIHSSDWTT